MKELLQKINDVQYYLKNYPVTCSSIDVEYANKIVDDLLDSINTALSNKEKENA